MTTEIITSVHFREKIQAENKTEGEWSLIESDDLFQSDNYEAGFDATEMEFCFSYYNEKQDEYWFQLPLDDIIKITIGIKNTFDIKKIPFHG